MKFLRFLLILGFAWSLIWIIGWEMMQWNKPFHIALQTSLPNTTIMFLFPVFLVLSFIPRIRDLILSFHIGKHVFKVKEKRSSSILPSKSNPTPETGTQKRSWFPSTGFRKTEPRISTKIRIPALRQIKRFGAGLLLILNFIFFVTLLRMGSSVTDVTSLIFLFNVLYFVDYLWKTRRHGQKEWEESKLET